MFDRNDHTDREIHNRRALLTVAMTVALAFALSSSLPGPVIPAAMESFLFFGAIGAILVAMLRRDDMKAPRLTGWDQALMLMFLSLASGFFVDPTAVHEHLEAMQETARIAQGAVPAS